MATPVDPGGADVVVRRIALDTILTDQEIVIGRRQMQIVRMDANFDLRFQLSEDPGTVNTPIGFCAARAIPRVFITTTAAVAGGLIDIWCADPGDGTSISVP